MQTNGQSGEVDNMKTFRRPLPTIWIVLLLIVWGPLCIADAAQVEVFGPRTYERGKGRPEAAVDRFAAAPGAGLLSVENGDAFGERRVTSASIFLNGEQVFGPDDFSRFAGRLEAPVDLLRQNDLSVTVRGSPGDCLTLQVFCDVQVPTVGFSVSPQRIRAGEAAVLSWSAGDATCCRIEPGIGDVDVSGSLSVYPETTTTYGITAFGPGGLASAELTVWVEPAWVKPQPRGSFGARYEGLIPTDVTLEAYDPQRFSVVTGLVRAADGAAVADVTVSILKQPQYGSAKTDGSGQFGIPVEGGGELTVVYQKPGFLTVHRRLYVGWNAVVAAQTVEMTASDPAATTVVFDGSPVTVVTHRSSVVTDAFGTRSCTLVFAGDNRAYEVDAAGSVLRQLSAVTVRATEYVSVGSMPAELPAASAYTYCAEMAVEGCDRVRFDRPVVLWVDNFLGFGVGEAVPAGTYDRDKGVWTALSNGRVVKLLDTDGNGRIDALDADGDDSPDDLNDSGSAADEVTGVEGFTPGASYFRVEVMHFSAVDLNWPYEIDGDGTAPNPAGQPVVDPPEDADRFCPVAESSFIEQRSRVFHEDIPVAGTDLTLHYAGSRAAGCLVPIRVPASGPVVPAGLKQITTAVEIAGKTYEQKFDPLPDQFAEFVWDAKDFLGNRVVSANAKITTGFVYDATYAGAADLEQAFGYAGLGDTGILARQQVVVTKIDNLPISIGPSSIAAGWSLSCHHGINPESPAVLHKGDGTGVSRPQSLVSIAAGSGVYGYSGDGGPAVEARLGFPRDLAVDPQGNLYAADINSYVIRRIDAEGVITTIAGNGVWGFGGDGGPATSATLGYWSRIDVDSAGNLFIADTENLRIRRIDAEGVITTIAGNGARGFGGDGGPATEARLSNAYPIEIDPSGNLFIFDQATSTIRRVDTTGRVTTVAVLPSQCAVENLVADASGSIYFTYYLWDPVNREKTSFVRRLGADGTTTDVAGSGGCTFDGPGRPATQTRIQACGGLAFDGADNMYVAHVGQDSVYVLKVDRRSAANPGRDMQFVEPAGPGHVMDAAGMHRSTIDPDTGTMLRQFEYDDADRLIGIVDRFGSRTAVARGADGTPYAVVSPDGLTTQLTLDTENRLIQILCPDGGLYQFEYTAGGLVTAKRDPLDNLFEYSYDSGGRLEGSFDEEGGHTTYGRAADAAGRIQISALTAEGSHTEYLDFTDAAGTFTSAITGPAGDQILYSRSADGLSVTKSLACGDELQVFYDVDSRHGFRYVGKSTESSPSGLQRKSLRQRSYQDTDFDGEPDLITETVTVNGRSRSVEKDTLGSQLRVCSAMGRRMTLSYDPQRLLIETISTPGFWDITCGYDNRGRLTSFAAGTRQTQFAYDDRGFLSSVTTPDHQTSSVVYDPMGRVVALHGPDGATVGFDYDISGNLTVLKTPMDIKHGFGYNRVGRVNAYQTPLSGAYSYLYDKDRRLVAVVFPSGARIGYGYEGDRLTKLQTPDGSIDVTYLCGNRPTALTKGDETIVYGYDGALLVSQTASGTLSQTLGYAYDDDFRVTSFTYAGASATYAYDDDGLLTGAGPFVITRNVDSGLPEKVEGRAANIDRTFSAYGELQEQSTSVAGRRIAGLALVRDDCGRIIEKTETIADTTANYLLTYDAAGRLTAVDKNGTRVETYDYDASGARIHEVNLQKGIIGKSYAYSVEDHLLTAGTAAYQYDPDGFLTTKTEGGNLTRYSYSLRGELLSALLPDGRRIEYRYDPLGRRIAKAVDGVTIEKYLWQGMTRLLAVYDGSDTLLMRFEYADDRTPVTMHTAGSTYCLAFDPVGSLRMVADTAGNVIKKVDYDAFGNVIADTHPTLSVPLGFAGGLLDKDTGLIRFGYRDYDPNTGRWTAKDPILFKSGNTDLYGYCLNDPVNWVDPLGLINLKRMGIGFIEATAGGLGIAVAATTGVTSAATATALAVGVATIAVPTFSHGITEIIAGLIESDAPIPPATGPAVATLAITGDINRAQEIDLISGAIMLGGNIGAWSVKAPRIIDLFSAGSDFVNLAGQSTSMSTCGR